MLGVGRRWAIASRAHDDGQPYKKIRDRRTEGSKELEWREEI